MSDSLIDVTISDSFINSIPELVIDSEFKEWLMPLSSEEYEYLERNIIADGCRDPLVVWNGILVDGHNRYEICKANGISFNTVESSLQTREEVKNWIINNQLGRRNVSINQRSYLIGKIYGETKNEHGGDRKSEESRGNNCHLKTDDEIADKFNVSPKTVRNAEKFANAVDTLAKKNVQTRFLKTVLESGLKKISPQTEQTN